MRTLPESPAAVPAAQPAPGFGPALRRWRLLRQRTQQALALDAEVSTRHLSWLESGRAEPSRAMVLKLAHALDVPLRERNALLQQAGYAPMFRAREWADPALAPAHAAMQRLLAAHEPWPALAVDRHWNLVHANRAVSLLLPMAALWLVAPPINVLRLSLHPEGLAPMIENLPAWRHHVLHRLARQAHHSADPALHALHAELQALPRALPTVGQAQANDEQFDTHPDSPVVPLVLNTPHGRLSFLTTVTVFGAPHDPAVSELAIETLLPADDATSAALRALVPAG
jgi:transcriptional regulator with XRE-family HTH domain